jgi:multidrug efflux pump
MEFSQFFVRRPIFAAVLSAIILIAGALSLRLLPISEYPEVVPPTVVVRANYPGANSQVIAETVAAPLEQAINGVEHLIYTSSTATTDGLMTLTVTFALGTDLDKAQVQVQNRVAQTLPKLPEVTQRLGVTTEKSTPDLTLLVHLTSPDNRYDMLYLANYATLYVRDELARIDGVGEARVFGAGDYAMRVWLDPEKVAALDLTPSDIVRSIRAQNVQVAAGQLGAPPAANGADFQLLIDTQGRLVTEEEFQDIAVKVGEQGQITRLRDVARVELGASTYALRSLLDGKPAAAIPIYQRPGSNAIDISNKVRETMAKLAKQFPQGVDYDIVYDPTMFVRQSIDAVVHTLFEALLLVVLVVLLFLQTWRASVIPLAAVPVSLVGTLAVMHLFGFSLNALSLFGLVLAIGIVVDDAIVVVENVERNIEKGLTPVAAAQQAMREVTSPIIATALVLIAVFVPTAFISGLTGQFYRQFALTIAISTAISAFNSLTLSPALAAVLLQPHGAPRDRLQRAIDAAFGWLLRPFNRLFEWSAVRYVGVAGRLLRRSGLAVAVYGGLLLLTWLGFASVPGGFIPQQDKQYLVAYAQLPEAATLDRTEAVIRQMDAIMLAEPGVAHAVSFPGLSINGFVNSANTGIAFAGLADFSKDGKHVKTSGRSAWEIAASLNRKLASIQDAYIAVFPPPAVQGLGQIGGFKVQIEDRAGLGFQTLYEETQKIVAAARQTPGLANVFSGFEINAPQIRANVDRDKAQAQGVQLSDLFDTMQVYLGSLYVNDFNRFGRTYQVNAQADMAFRLEPDDILRLKVRNKSGEMVPLGSFVTLTQTSGPSIVSRYNGYPTAEITGGPAPGASSGQAQAALEKLASQELPNGLSYDWTELAFQQLIAGNTAVWIFPLCVLLAFLVLAAQYESFVLPLVVILIVPMCQLSAIAGVWLSGGDNNIFTQIGLIVLVGLACKNAILIVEFARTREQAGASTWDAVLEACRLRLRPILMTSIAFIAGVVPLVVSRGAGAEMRNAMGIAVFAGMLGVTVFGLLLTPVFYWVVRRLGAAARRGRAPAAAAASLVLSACAVGPNYTPPETAAPAFHHADSAVVEQKPIEAAWWTQFGDPTLDSLVDRALTGDLDLKIAAARVQESRALASAARRERWPGVDVAAAHSKSKAQQPGFTTDRIAIESNQVAISTLWEIDLFGRIRRGAEAASADAEAAEADLRDAQVLVAAEVASTYLDLRGSQKRLAVARANLESQRETLSLTRVRLELGRGSELDVSSAAARLAATEAIVPSLVAAEASAVHRLAVLLGREPGTLDEELAPRDLAPRVTTLAVGSPEELLRRRPDIRAAERELAAATARIGVAKADLFPRLTLTGLIGFIAGDASELGEATSRAWAVSPVLSWGGLEPGVRSRIVAAEARAQGALAVYDRAVLRALEETETAFVGYAQNRVRLAAVVDEAAQSRRAADLARVQYREGALDFLRLLDAERSVLQAEDAVATAETDLNTSVVKIYKALGGGWEAATPQS